MSKPTRILYAAMFLSPVFMPEVVEAAEARHDVHPEHGEMVLLRSVPARPAYRTAPPGIAVIVDPRPTGEISDALGTGELSDADFAALESGNGLGPAATHNTTVGAMVDQTLASGLLDPDSSRGGDAGVRTSPLGAIGNVTRGISHQVNSALSQFPLGEGGP